MYMHVIWYQELPEWTILWIKLVNGHLLFLRTSIPQTYHICPMKLFVKSSFRCHSNHKCWYCATMWKLNEAWLWYVRLSGSWSSDGRTNIYSVIYVYDRRAGNLTECYTYAVPSLFLVLVVSYSFCYILPAYPVPHHTHSWPCQQRKR